MHQSLQYALVINWDKKYRIILNKISSFAKWYTSESEEFRFSKVHTLFRLSCVIIRTGHMQRWYGSVENKFSNRTQHTISTRYICLSI